MHLCRESFLSLGSDKQSSTVQNFNTNPSVVLQSGESVRSLGLVYLSKSYDPNTPLQERQV
jgi:hypothetical protein